MTSKGGERPRNAVLVRLKTEVILMGYRLSYWSSVMSAYLR